ncbi:diphthine synthase [Candidatus Micrarchaeota archaeon]|nr:diphthine synthase [Candidatus Micrarchaeota archaeon]
MTLILVGSGISFDLTLSGVQALEKCDEAYIETYTNLIEEEKIKKLEKQTKKKIIHLDRTKIESSFLVEKAKTADICLISSGDPLTATTHISLVLEAREKKIPVKIIHNSSIYSAAPARAGLQIYRFGKTATLVNPRPNYQPTSSLDVIRTNLKNDMHTLVLLDTEPQPMDAKTALEMLSEFDSAVILSRLGSKDEKITYGKIKELQKLDSGRPPFAVIIPANLHILEKEFLEL